MKNQSATLKIGTPEIRVGLAAAKPKSSNIKRKPNNGHTMLTNDASMPKNKKRLIKAGAKIKVK